VHVTYDPQSPADSPPRARARQPLLGNMAAPTAVLILAEVAVFVAQLVGGGPDRWALSAQRLAAGAYDTLLTHMFSHAGFLHIFMNLTALATFSAVVVPWLGRGAGAWLRYYALFLLSGLAGALMFLAIHPNGATPMLGASGAICGVWGAAVRLPPYGGALLPIRNPLVFARIRQFAVSNLVIFAIIFGLVLLSGGQGGLAWEAHLGGFLFGLLTVPLFAVRLPAAPWGAPGA
jgi:membrane associated rhomboid family serine protease